MRSKYVLIAVVLIILAFGVGRLSAAVRTVDSPDVPANTLSYTLEDIWNRLDSGADGAQSTFTEPAAGPGTGTGHKLDQVMGVAPVVDDANGATTAYVLTTKTYWSRRTANWGHQSGTMPDNGAVTIVPTTTQQAIVVGYHDGSGKVEGDADLVASKIVSDVVIFEVTGSAIAATGDATAGDVLTGKTFSNASAAGIAGAMPDNGAVTIVPTTTNQTIDLGYHDGSGKVEGDADLVASKIVSDVVIFEVTGSAIAAIGDATAGDVLTGKAFSNDSAAGIGGAMPDNGAVTIVPTTTNQTIALGYHDGSGKVEGDADLVAGKIKSGENIFGVAGTLAPGGTATAADLFRGETAHLTGDWTLGTGTLDLACNTATFDGTGNLVHGDYDGGGDGTNRWCMKDTGDAAAGDILQGKKAWVAGSEVTGNIATQTVVSTTVSQAAGYYDAFNLSTEDPDLATGNIKSGVDIFGVTGSYAGTICTGNATTADVLYPKTFSNSSSTGLTGELHGGCTCCSTCTLYASRWCDNGDGTVTDLTTCLVWLKDADWGDNGDWGGAHTRAGKLNASTSGAGLSDGSVLGDWRLPTKNEFEHLLNGSPNIRCTAANSKCNKYGFTGIAGRWAAVGGAEGNYGYWTSTTMASDNSRAYYIEPATGDVLNEAKSWVNGLVWPVRGGQ